MSLSTRGVCKRARSVLFAGQSIGLTSNQIVADTVTERSMVNHITPRMILSVMIALVVIVFYSAGILAIAAGVVTNTPIWIGMGGGFGLAGTFAAFIRSLLFPPPSQNK